MSASPLSLGILTGSVSRLAGGVFNSVCRSALALRAQGVDVSVYAPEDMHTQEDLPAWAPIVPQVFPRRFIAALGYGAGLEAALMAGKHDVLHLHGIWQHNSRVANHWRAATGGPVIISPHGMLDPWALKQARWKKALVSRLFESNNLAGAACMHALNESEAQSMRDYGLTQPAAIIPNGADAPDLSVSHTKPAWMDDGRKTLFFLGRIHEKKGLGPLVDGWGRLRDTRPELLQNWRLAIAGWDDGGYEAQLREQVASAALSDEIIFTGPLFGADKAAALAHADAFILPSYSEGLPMSVLEAWSYGLPVFMTQACNIPQGFAAGAAVEVTTDEGSIAKALAAHLPNEDSLTAMGKAGRALVQKDFTWPSIAARHIDVYRALLGGGDWPASIIT